MSQAAETIQQKTEFPPGVEDLAIVVGLEPSEVEAIVASGRINDPKAIEAYCAQTRDFMSANGLEADGSLVCWPMAKTPDPKGDPGLVPSGEYIFTDLMRRRAVRDLQEKLGDSFEGFDYGIKGTKVEVLSQANDSLPQPKSAYRSGSSNGVDEFIASRAPSTTVPVQWTKRGGKNRYTLDPSGVLDLEQFSLPDIGDGNKAIGLLVGRDKTDAVTSMRCISGRRDPLDHTGKSAKLYELHVDERGELQWYSNPAQGSSIRYTPNEGFETAVQLRQNVVADGRTTSIREPETPQTSYGAAELWAYSTSMPSQDATDRKVDLITADTKRQRKVAASPGAFLEKTRRKIVNTRRLVGAVALFAVAGTQLWNSSTTPEQVQRQRTHLTVPEKAQEELYSQTDGEIPPEVSINPSTEFESTPGITSAEVMRRNESFRAFFNGQTGLLQELSSGVETVQSGENLAELVEGAQTIDDLFAVMNADKLGDYFKFAKLEESNEKATELTARDLENTKRSLLAFSDVAKKFDTRLLDGAPDDDSKLRVVFATNLKNNKGTGVGGWASSSTTGREIYIGVGDDTDSEFLQALSAHELTHIVDGLQQILTELHPDNLPQLSYDEGEHIDYPTVGPDGKVLTADPYGLTGPHEYGAANMQPIGNNKLPTTSEGLAWDNFIDIMAVLEKKAPGITAHILNLIAENNPDEAILPTEQELREKAENLTDEIREGIIQRAENEKARDEETERLNDIETERLKKLELLKKIDIFLLALLAAPVAAETVDTHKTRRDQVRGADVVKDQKRRTMFQKLFRVAIRDK